MVLNVDDHSTELNMSIDYWDGKVPTAVVNQVASMVQVILADILEDANHEVSRVRRLVNLKE